jgi:uncharacterized protein (TIGR02217 family)
MAFHNVRFPEDIGYGSQGGAAYSTNIITLDSGQEVRIARWSQPRHKYDASYGIRSLDDLTTVINFFHARHGTANAFRWKDHLDFSSDSTGRGTPAWNDHTLGILVSAPETIQLRKSYVNGGETTYRNITKPTAGSTVVGWGGANKTSGWSIDEETGIITITDSGADGLTITAGCQFDVPVRFGEELDDGLMMSHDAFEIGSISSIPVIEIKSPIVSTDDYNYGGSKEYFAADDLSHSYADGRVVWTELTTGTATITLPEPTNYFATGGAYFYALHKGIGGSFVVKNHLGATIVSLGAALGAIIVCVISSGGVRSWEKIA